MSEGAVCPCSEEEAELSAGIPHTVVQDAHCPNLGRTAHSVVYRNGVSWSWAVHRLQCVSGPGRGSKGDNIKLYVSSSHPVSDTW